MGERFIDGYEYRFERPRGLERRPSYSQYWEAVSGEALACMTPAELRHVADVIERTRAAPERGEEEGDG